MILSFSGYSFCKPHSASYALVSFKSAWLKAHHPAEFMAAVLKNEGGYYSPFAYVSECRRMGIEVRPPDVNASGESWTGRSAVATERASESGAATAARGWIRIGLGQIVGLKEKAVTALLAEREKRGPFDDFDALLRRLPLDPADLRRLVRAGALDTLERSVAGVAGGPLAARTRLHWRLRAWETHGAARKPGKTPGLFAPEPVTLPAVKGPAPDEAAANAGRLLRDEEEAIGYLISRHPLTLYREALLALRRAGVQPVRGADMGKHVGERVAMVGWLVTGKIVTTKDDEPMEFVSFEDTTAIYETVFFPRAYERFCRMLTTARPYVLRGRIEEEFGVATLRVEEVEFLRRETRARETRGTVRSGGGPVAGKPGVSRGGAVAAGAGAAAAPAAGRPGSPRTTPSGRPAPRRGTPDPLA
jgi:error-prone DNA polymerase